MRKSRGCRVVVLLFIGLFGCGARAKTSDAGMDGIPSDGNAGVGPVVVVVQNITLAEIANRYSSLAAATNNVPAIFLDEVTLCQDPAAVITTVAGCSVMRCIVEGPDIVGWVDAGLTATLVDVGPITASSIGKVATTSTADYYHWVDNPTVTPLPAGFTWQPGAEVSVSGGGQGGLATFDGSVAFPPGLTGTGFLAASGVQSISQATSVDVTWTADAAASGMVTIQIHGEEEAPTTTWQTAICQAPVASGSFHLPPALLATFKTGPNAYVMASTDVRTSTAAGTRAVTLAARSLVVQSVVFRP